MMKKLLYMLICAMAVAALSCCGSKGAAADGNDSAKAAGKTPAFNADSAYAYVAAQVAFGPRVPGSQASRQAAQWLVETLEGMGASNVQQQRAQVTAYNGDVLDICNITAQLAPEAKRRVMLLAHYDSRPWADQEPDPADRERPIDGANDGASGVGVILEILRNAAQQAPGIGIDVLFADAEDYGHRADEPAIPGADSTWCLGTQHWVQQPTLDIGAIEYAVLLDMVGGRDAVFHREYFSEAANSRINDIVWGEAANAGYAARFPNEVGNPIIDDHIYLMRMGVPAIDIIESANPLTRSFNPVWHTRADNIDNIDPETMRIVGQTLLNVIYRQ